MTSFSRGVSLSISLLAAFRSAALCSLTRSRSSATLTAFAPPEFNRFSQFYELRVYGIGLLPSRPRDLLSLVIARNVFSHYLVDAALQRGQLADSESLSITAAYSGPIAPGIRAGIGLGYTDHPSPVIYTPQTGSALNLLANVITYW